MSPESVRPIRGGMALAKVPAAASRRAPTRRDDGCFVCLLRSAVPAARVFNPRRQTIPPAFRQLRACSDYGNRALRRREERPTATQAGDCVNVSQHRGSEKNARLEEEDSGDDEQCADAGESAPGSSAMKFHGGLLFEYRCGRLRPVGAVRANGVPAVSGAETGVRACFRGMLPKVGKCYPTRCALRAGRSATDRPDRAVTRRKILDSSQQ